MNTFNPPKAPAADRRRSRRRRQRNRSRTNVLPEWAPIISYIPPSSDVSEDEEDISPKTLPKRSRRAYPEEVVKKFEAERQPQLGIVPALPKTQMGVPPRQHQADQASLPTTYHDPKPKAPALPADHHYPGGRIIHVATFHRPTNTWHHEAIQYSTLQQATDYCHLMSGSVPCETLESHRNPHRFMPPSWPSPDVFDLKWQRLSLRETMTEGAQRFMSSDISDFLEDEKTWDLLRAGDENPPYLLLELELELSNWRRAIAVGVRQDVMRDAGIPSLDLRLQGGNMGGEPGPAVPR